MMNRILKVGIDLDNTVADFMATAAPLIKERYGLEPDFSRPVNTIENAFGISPHNRPSGLLEDIMEGKHLFRNLAPLDDGIEQLTHKLLGRKERTNVYMITARTATDVIVEDTMHWLRTNNFVFTDVFFTADKANLCKNTGINVMMEDEMGQILALLKAGIPVVIRDQPWNNNGVFDSFEKNGKAKRAKTWQEMLHATEEYLQ